MGKFVHDDVMDLGLHHILASCDIIAVVMNEPSTYASAFNTSDQPVQSLCSRSTLASDHFALAADASGRKVTLEQKADITIVNNGTADHIALGWTTDEKLILVTTCTQQVLTSGGTVTINAFKDNILDAA